MPLNAKQLELPYFIPTSENVSQILAELRTENQTPIRDTDYSLFRRRHERKPWRWEGAGRHVGINSAKTFATEAQADADAQKKLR